MFLIQWIFTQFNWEHNFAMSVFVGIEPRVDSMNVGWWDSYDGG